MQHLVLTKYGDPAESVQLSDGPDPSPGPGDVVVRVEAAAINPSDFLLVQGRYLVRPELPAPLGAEGVGIVEEAGGEVDHDLIGKRVILLPTFKFGSWSEKVVVAAQDVVVVAPDADPLQLAMLTINPVTAHLLLDRFGDLQVGDWVGQTAANSAVGRLVITLAKRRGLKTLSVVRREDTAEELRRAGADLVVLDGPELTAEVKRALDGRELSLVLDALGGSQASGLIGALKFGGAAVTYGSLIGPPDGVGYLDLIARHLSYTGFWLGNWYFRADRAEITETLSYLARLVAEGELSVPVEASYPLTDYLKAFEHASAPARGGKVVFSFG